MNTNRIRQHLGHLILIAGCFAIAWFVLTPAKTSAAGQPGRLVILRAANIGPQVVGLKIDGVQTAQIYYNRNYDAPLAAGPHVLTVFPVVGRGTARPTSRSVTVEPGRTYTFTASWQDTQIVLQ